MFYSLLKLEAKSLAPDEKVVVGGSSFRLFVIWDGRGSLWLDRLEYSVSKEECILASPDMLVTLSNGSTTGLHYYELSFRQEKSTGMTPTMEIPLYAIGPLQSQPFAQVLKYIAELLERDETSEFQLFRKHVRFQELLLFLLEQNQEEYRETGSLLAVERTIKELQTKYTEPYSLEQLAKQAKIGAWQYRQLFKKLTGSNPKEYITKLRIDRAKELLFVSNSSLEHIAQTVGYQDVYYFTRTFTKVTGMSPRKYLQVKRSHLRIIAFSHLGDIMALGIKPIGAELGLVQWLNQKYTRGIEGITCDSTGLKRAAELKPDLIIVNAFMEQKFVDGLKKIAPTISLELRSNMLHNMKQVAKLLGKEAEARSWLANYKREAKLIKEQIGDTIGKKETAIFYHVVNGKIYVYRPSEVPVIYQVLGFDVPYALKKLMLTSSSRLFIPVEDFSHYTADRIFIVHGRMDGAQETYKQIVQSAEWSSLPAVRRHQVYYFPDSWTLDGTIALSWQLDGIIELLETGERY
jgi:ABC-type Fe3+-hydroxamate transport system, periplasmic component